MPHPAREWIFGFAVIGFLLFPLFGGSGSEKTTQEEQIRALRDLENKWLASEDNQDVLETILADDFVHVLPFGFVNKQVQIGYLRKHKVEGAAIARYFEDLRMRVYGKTGIVNGIVVAEGRAGGARSQTVFTDVFVFRNSRWQAVNALEIPFLPGSPWATQVATLILLW